QVHTNTEEGESLVSVLDLIAAKFVPGEKIHALECRFIRVLRIEIPFSIAPAGSEARAVVERGVHLKIFSVVFDLRGDAVLAVEKGIRNLRRCAIGCWRGIHSRLGFEKCCRELLPLPESDRHV